MEGGTNDDMIQKRFGLDIPVFVILQEKLEDILSKAPDWWGTSDKDIYDNLIFVMSPATAEIIAEKIGEPTKGLEQICICDNTIFGLSTGINIVDLVNPEKLFFIGNRNFEFVEETNMEDNKSMTVKKTVKSGITFGSALAMVISYTTWKSVGWAIFHGLLSWVYVIYFLLRY